MVMAISLRYKSMIYLIIFLMFVCGGGNTAQYIGHVQIKCEPEVQIFLDGNFLGKTRSEMGGLILENVPSGKHSLKAVKEGCQPLEVQINLSEGQVYMHEFKAFLPQVATYEEGQESQSRETPKTGKIIIQSLPMECTITIPSLNVRDMQKKKDRRILDKVPAGEYKMEFSALNRTLPYTLYLKPDQTVKIMVNFLKGAVNEENVRADGTSMASRTAGTGDIPAIAPPTPAGTTAPSAGTILYSDTFTGPDRIRPANWKILGTDSSDFWYTFENQFTTGNGDNLPGFDGYSYAVLQVPGSETWTDYSIQCSFWLRQANGQMILVARWKDKDNHYEGVLESFRSNRYLRITRVVNGKRNDLKTLQNGQDGIFIPPVEDAYSPSDAETMRFTVSGSKLSLSFADQIEIEAEDGSLKAGTAGLGECYYFIFFDNVIVQK